MNQEALPDRNIERNKLASRLSKVFQERGGAMVAIREVIQEARPEDVADALSLLSPQQRLDIYRALPEDDREVVVEEADPVVTTQLLKDLETSELIGLVETMPPDDAADVVGELPDDVQHHVLREVEKADPEQAEDIRDLLEYPPHSAGGLMTPDFVQITDTASAGSALTAIQGAFDAETINICFVTNLEDKLVGVVSIRQLLMHKPQRLVTEFMEREFISANVTDDQSHAASLLARYNLQVLPICDQHGIMRGIITVDDVIDAIQEEFSQDLFLLAGTTKPEYVRESILIKGRKRFPWLLITLILGLLLAYLLSNWESLLEKNAKLAFFLPVLAAMAGNAGIQASTLMVRTLSTSDLGSNSISALLWIELRIALLIGSACAGLMLFAATILGGDWHFGIVVSAGMFVGMVNATVLGTLIPLFFHRLNIDPAMAAGPFITTLNDVFSLVIYLTFASLFLTL